MAKKLTTPPLPDLSASKMLTPEMLPYIARNIQKSFHDIEEDLRTITTSCVQSVSPQELAEKMSQLTKKIDEMQKTKLPVKIKNSIKKIGLDLQSLTFSLTENDGKEFEPNLKTATDTLDNLRAFAARIPEVAALLDIVDERPLQPSPELPKIVEPSKFKVQDVKRVHPKAP